MRQYFTKLKSWLNKQIEPLDFRQRVILAIISISLPLFLYVYWFLFPSIEQIKLISEENEKLRQEIVSYRKLARQKPLLEAKLARRKVFFKKLVYILPNEKEIPELLSRVSEQAKNSGLDVVSFAPRSEIVQNYYNIIPFSLELRGSFSEFILFWEKVEHLPRIITLNSMSLQMREGKAEKFYLSAKCVFHTYRYTGKPITKRKRK